MLWMMMLLIWRGAVAGVLALVSQPKTMRAAIPVKVRVAVFDGRAGLPMKPRAPP